MAKDTAKSPRKVEPATKGFAKRVSGFFTKMLYSEDPEPSVMEIGTPYNFQHIQHVRPDAHTSTGFSVSFLFFV